MSQNFYTHSINIYGRGFFAAALPRSDESFLKDSLAPHWLEWEDIFECAKQGNFSRTPRLLDLFDTNDLTLNSAITSLLAFAGSSEALEAAADMVGGEGQLAHINLCEALTISGNLRFVPAVVDSYARLNRDGWLELEMIPVWLRYALADPGGLFHDGVPIPEFTAQVVARQRYLVQRYGSDTMCVFEGEAVSPIYFAQELRRCAGQGKHAMVAPLRAHFEAYTGTDCHHFFDENMRPKPLNIASIAEEFLAQPTASNYVEGVRYFFGHRVP